MPSKPRKQEKKPAPPSPLDAKQRALAEEQEKLRREIERNERLIKEAPKIAKEWERTRREELIKRRSRTDARPGSHVALHDRRHQLELDPGRPLRQKKLRAERRRGRLLFFVLLFTFGMVVYWAYWVFTHQ